MAASLARYALRPLACVVAHALACSAGTPAGIFRTSTEVDAWSFYICSSGGSLNEGWIGDSEAERQEHLRLLGHFLAQQRDEI
jgi:hypothetical protein